MNVEIMRPNARCRAVDDKGNPRLYRSRGCRPSMPTLLMQLDEEQQRALEDFRRALLHRAGVPS